jgi:hypothetical protein
MFLTAVIDITPVTTTSMTLRASGMARDGSIGVASIRDRRFGGALAAITPWVRGGVELAKAYGIGDRGDLEGVLAGGWADAGLGARMFISARASTLGRPPLLSTIHLTIH